MKKLFILAVIALFLGTAPASATNITQPDMNSSAPTGWYGQQEDNEVEPGMATGQKWDLEGFILNGTELTLVGGYNFKEGETGNSKTFLSGDIFIDVNGPPVYGASSKSTNGYENVSNTFGYDYALVFNWTNFTYDVYSIDGSTQVTTAYYKQNQGSNPWKYVSGGTKELTASLKYETGTNPYGFLGDNNNNWHNQLTVDLGFLLGETLPLEKITFWAHFTMGCGNDNIMGSGTIPNPEPGTMLLLGFGLIGIAGFLRRKQ